MNVVRLREIRKSLESKEFTQEQLEEYIEEIHKTLIQKNKQLNTYADSIGLIDSINSSVSINIELEKLNTRLRKIDQEASI